MTFEDLEAWQEARKLVNAIYAMTRHSSLAEDYGLSRQVQRAAVSVMSNLAEGFERSHVAEKLQAYNIARGSCGEVRSLLYVVVDNFPAVAVSAREIQQAVRDTGSLVSGLIASTRKRIAVKVGGTVALALPVLWVAIQLFR